jgi:hypothetical protein
MGFRLVKGRLPMLVAVILMLAALGVLVHIGSDGPWGTVIILIAALLAIVDLAAYTKKWWW